jgi:hypothetical protein
VIRSRFIQKSEGMCLLFREEPDCYKILLFSPSIYHSAVVCHLGRLRVAFLRRYLRLAFPLLGKQPVQYPGGIADLIPDVVAAVRELGVAGRTSRFADGFYDIPGATNRNILVQPPVESPDGYVYQVWGQGWIAFATDWQRGGK